MHCGNFGKHTCFLMKLWYPLPQSRVIFKEAWVIQPERTVFTYLSVICGKPLKNSQHVNSYLDLFFSPFLLWYQRTFRVSIFLPIPLSSFTSPSPTDPLPNRTFIPLVMAPPISLPVPSLFPPWEGSSAVALSTFSRDNLSKQLQFFLREQGWMKGWSSPATHTLIIIPSHVKNITKFNLN